MYISYTKGDNMNKSALRTIDVLEFIAENKQGVTLTEISKELKLPMASASDILKSLMSKRMVELGESRTYKIGVKNLLLGNAYLANIDVVAVSMPFIDALSEQTHNTVFLGKLIDDRITYLYKREPIGLFVSTCRIGSRADLSTTALGKVVLAYNEDIKEATLSKPLRVKTRHSITDPDVLRKELVDVKVKGYSVDMMEHDDRILCVGLPIFDEAGRVEHCISISGIYQESRDIEREVELGKICAGDISRKLGYLGKAL